MPGKAVAGGAGKPPVDGTARARMLASTRGINLPKSFIPKPTQSRDKRCPAGDFETSERISRTSISMQHIACQNGHVVEIRENTGQIAPIRRR